MFQCLPEVGAKITKQLMDDGSSPTMPIAPSQKHHRTDAKPAALFTATETD